MSDSLMLTKAKAFAIRIVKLHSILRGKREATMSKQILRCGTSIGANLAEAKFAQSKEDFISKQTIALKEAGETLYWLELLHDVDLIPDDESYRSIYADCEEIVRMLIGSLKKLNPKG
jgi:four helix bundle protein